MADDYYRFVEKQHLLHGENTGKTYRLGDRVQVQVTRVDLDRRQIELGIVDILESVRKSERNRGPRRSKAPLKRGAPQSAAPAAALKPRRAARPGRRERAQRKAVDRRKK